MLPLCPQPQHSDEDWEKMVALPSLGALAGVKTVPLLSLLFFGWVIHFSGTRLSLTCLICGRPLAPESLLGSLVA